MAWYSQLPFLFAQAGANAPRLSESPVIENPMMKFLLALAILFGSFAVGALIARGLKMREYGVKIGLILFTLFAAIAVCYLGWPPKLGIDLSGGVVLVYEVDQNKMEEEGLEQALKRVNEELQEQKAAARLTEAGEIEILLPKGGDIEAVEERINQLSAAGLELNLSDRRTEGDRPVLVYRVENLQSPVEMDKLIAAVKRRIDPSGVKELTIRQYGRQQLEVIIPEVDKREVELIKKQIGAVGSLEFRILANTRDHKSIIDLARQTPGNVVYDGGEVVARWVNALGDVQPPSEAQVVGRQIEEGLQYLVVMDQFNVTGGYIDRAAPGIDESGSYAVHFNLDSTGANLFGGLTGSNLPDTATGFSRQLAIVLDDVIQSSASIRSTITSNGQITGQFSQEYVEFLVNVLNAGSLPAALNKSPIAEDSISAQLGDDTIRSGSNAMIISTIAVLAFMLVYYRFAGMVADIAVVMNLILVVALMIAIQAAFTLPGLAGLVLTVGMAVDANVLIYERMREERNRGASLRMAIRNGFSRAMTTIIDSNLTTVITAIVLYAIGTDQIKGFAITLILGLMVSMYTAIFVARVIFDIFERKRWLTDLRMMRMIGETHFDFVRWIRPAVAASVIIISIGMGAAVMRGKNLLDIDFTGGTSVHVLFTEPRSIADVRRELSEVIQLPDVAVSSVGGGNKEFKVDTSEAELATVREKLQEYYKSDLVHYSMTFGELAQVGPNDKPSAKAEAEPPADSAAPDTGKSQPDTDDKQPAAPTTPANGDGARHDLPDDSQLALADFANPFGVGVQLAQAEGQEPADPAPTDQADPAPADEAQPAADPAPADPAPADGQAAPAQPAESEAPAPGSEAADTTEATPATETPADQAAPAETPAATTDQAAPATAETPADTAAAATPAAVQNPYLGGTKVELHFPEKINYSALREVIERELEEAKLGGTRFTLSNPEHRAGANNQFETWQLQTTLPPEEARPLLERIQNEFNTTPVFPSSSEIGGKVAGDTQVVAIYALTASLIMIVLYVWFRFQNLVFGLAAVLALVHDVAVTVGFLALSSYLALIPGFEFLLIDPFKISLPVVAALLTIVGYSINDTIVIFDRIREIRGKSPNLSAGMINDALNQTLSRTLLTSSTVMMGTLILYVAGGQGIHAFAFAMLIGLFSGTYSTVYIAAPILLWLKKPTDATQRRSWESPQTSGAR